MSKRPEAGVSLCLPCKVEHVRDGDTVVVSLNLKWAIRLIDCWAPEVNTKEGIDARLAAVEALQSADELFVEIPNAKHVEQLLRNLTFDRIPGRLWLSDQETLGEVMVNRGHATRERQ